MSTPTPTTQLSAVEILKAGSNGLRGTLLESLADPITGALREGDAQLLKFHGSYQQDDRDVREERRKQKLEPAYSFMIRTRLPGGVATAKQWLDLDALSLQYGNGSLRITTRQAFQIHGIIKRNLKPTSNQINFVKHLIDIGHGMLPGLKVATDDSLAPVLLLQDIYQNIYNLKQYAPIMMHTQYYHADRIPVYASMPFPTQLDYCPKERYAPSTSLSSG